MEVQLPFSPTSFFLFIILFLTLINQYKKSNRNQRLPPGPWKLPIIGSIHHLVAGSLPHHVLRDLSRKYGPLMHLQLGEISTIVVSSPQMVEEVMKTHDLAFAERPEVIASEIMFYNKMDIAFAPYGDYWIQMRKIGVTELLTNQRVKSFRCIREQEVLEMVTSIGSSLGSPINVSEKVFSLSSSVVCIAAFGKKLPCQNALLGMICEALALMGGLHVADLFPSLKILQVGSGMKRRLETIHLKIDNILDGIISERREKSGYEGIPHGDENEDLLDVLLRLQQSRSVDFPFTDNNVKAVIFEMFVGGTDVVGAIMEWAMSEMMKNPKVMAKAQAELRQGLQAGSTMKEGIESRVDRSSYLKLVIKETLRLHPPGPFLIPRHCREACEIAGYNIPIKTRVMVNVWAIGRDAHYWQDAETFMPERFWGNPVDFLGTHFQFVPFGAGRRMCPGVSFGLAVVELALAQLLYHFDWALPDGMKASDLDMTETSGLTATRKNKLLLIATPYNPVPGGVEYIV